MGSIKKSGTALSDLIASIKNDAIVVEDFLEQNSLPVPTFNAYDPPFMGVPATAGPAAEAYERLLMSSHELNLLVKGPMQQMKSMLPEDTLTWNVLSRFNVCENVPIGEMISYEDLAKACGVPVLELRQVARYAMTNFILFEPKPGFVAHTATSRAIKEKPVLKTIFGTFTEEMFPAMSAVADSIEKHPGSQEPSHSGWNLANNASLPMFEELAENHPARAQRFAKTMAAMFTISKQNPNISFYPWEELGEATVVDIGGGSGPVSIALARKFPKLKFIVQDLPETCKQGEASLPEDVKDRVTFQAHNFFTEQPVKDADVYYMRMIFHDWSDKYCAQILRNLIPALKKGARILINDRHVPEPLTMTPFLERDRRKFNLMMMTTFNSRDREAGEWEQLFREADERFEYRGTTTPPCVDLSRTPVLAFSEAIWRG